jgi:hypothetical protein
MPKSELPEWCWLLKELLKEIEEEQEEGAGRAGNYD